MAMAVWGNGGDRMPNCNRRLQAQGCWAIHPRSAVVCVPLEIVTSWFLEPFEANPYD
ncbi:hypothetical protein H6F48_01910 [Limnothrix sp. FACHB-1088]|nr:hypothetical protein [Limnothrix sp. FACHB-1088]